MPCQEPPAYHEYFTGVDRLGESVLALFRRYRMGVLHDCQVATLFVAIQGGTVTVDWIRSSTNAPSEITVEEITTIFTELTDAGILYHAGYRTTKKRGAPATRISVWRLGDADLAKARLATLRTA